MRTVRKEFGDLEITLSHLGLDIYHKEGKRLCFFNEKGAKVLGEELQKYYEKTNKRNENTGVEGENEKTK